MGSRSKIKKTEYAQGGTKIAVQPIKPRSKPMPGKWRFCPIGYDQFDIQPTVANALARTLWSQGYLGASAS